MARKFKIDENSERENFPFPDDGAVTVNRENSELTVTVLEGGLKLKEITDKYGVDLNEGEPKEYHVSMPQQYHIYYTAEAAKTHRLTVRYDKKIKRRLKP